MNLEDRTSERMSEATRQRWQAKRQRDGDKFISGPLPLPWLGKAAKLPGKALAVGLGLWFLRGLIRESRLSFTPSTWNQFGLSRSAVYRGLEQLESAGLVTVERHRGRCPVVTLKNPKGRTADTKPREQAMR